ncbi:AraC family transcriptional regulator [Nocardioides sp. NPDC023903]|uniref:helix-turn-helix transcriptional regulator n=1 Tax=Nocardioides sp. NPDC023903 TaxID=3157195 RepID=UPI0033F112C8
MTRMATEPLPDSCCDDARPTVWLWSGHAAYRGPSLRLGAHSGSVTCFALGLDAPFLLRAGQAEPRRVRSALIPARTSHQIVVGEEQTMLFFYADPGASGTAHLLGAMTDRAGTIAYDHRDEAALLADWRQGPVTDPEMLRRRLLDAGEMNPTDERIRVAMQLLRDRPGERGSAAEMAAAVNLSQSRFLHLFSAHSGTSFRRYRLWARMRYAAAAVSQGADLSTAASDAGFASPSHFSDTFRAMFGLTATQLLSNQLRIVVMEHRAVDEPLTSS